MPDNDIQTYDDYGSMERNGYSHPYVYELGHGSHVLTFYGADHSNDPNHKQFTDIEEQWQSFTAHATSPMAFVEGNSDSWPMEATADRLSSIERGGESVFMVHLARRDGVPIVSPDPDMTVEDIELSQQFGRANVALFRFLGRLHWLGDSAQRPDLETEVPKILDGLRQTHQWDDVDFSLEGMRRLYEGAVGRPLDIQNRVVLGQSVSPATQQTVLNDISRYSGDLRDKNLLEKIKTSWAEGNSPFVVYGAAHAIRLEKALRALGTDKA